MSHRFPAHLTLQIFFKGSQYNLLFYRSIQEDNIVKIYDIFSDPCRNGHLSKTAIKVNPFFNYICSFFFELTGFSTNSKQNS